jgi:hypothetical protein
MFRIGTLGLIIIAAMLAFTNPNFEAHKNAVLASAAAEATNSETVGKIAGDVLGKLDVAPLTYHNYYVFSTTTFNGDTASVGLLSRVWKLNRDMAKIKK